MNAAASRYAKALFSLSTKDYRKSLKDFLSLLQKNPTIDRFFTSPHIPLKSKSAVLDKALEKGLQLDSTVVTLLKLLLKNGRFEALPEIVQEYSRLIREKLGIAEAFLKSAMPLNAEQMRAFKEKLEKFTGKEMELEISLDPKLLGGGVLTLNNHLLDFSVKGKLARLKEGLLNPGLKAWD